MLVGMTTTKIAISLPEDAVLRVREAVRSGRAASVSAYIAEAIRERVTRDDLAGMLDAMLAETGGPLTARERRSIDAELGVTRRRPRRA
jgi:Arc/MetJ-type ribon-helix-helix transcriptional regulator